MASSQKFIARNRAPRVQIEYDVEVYGAQKKVDLPFVMGVLSDLSGKSAEPLPSVADRKFLEIDVDTFDDRMKAMRPRVAFTVPNTLTGEGNLSVDLTFESMEDFTPGAIASRVDGLRQLLQARTELSNLMVYMDGKTGAEDLIERVLGDRGTLAALASGTLAKTVASETDAALAALRNAVPVVQPEPDPTPNTLAALRNAMPVAQPEPDPAPDALAALRNAVPPAQPEPDPAPDALAALRSAVPVAQPEPDPAPDALAALRNAMPVAQPEPDPAPDALAALRSAVPTPQPEPDPAPDALAALRNAVPPAQPEPDPAPDALAALRNAVPVVQREPDPAPDALAALRSAVPFAQPEPDPTPDALAVLRNAVPTTQPEPDPALDALRNAVPVAQPDPDPTPDALAALRRAVPVAQPQLVSTPEPDDPLAGLMDLDLGAAADDPTIPPPVAPDPDDPLAALLDMNLGPADGDPITGAEPDDLLAGPLDIELGPVTGDAPAPGEADDPLAALLDIEPGPNANDSAAAEPDDPLAALLDIDLAPLESDAPAPLDADDPLAGLMDIDFGPVGGDPVTTAAPDDPLAGLMGIDLSPAADNPPAPAESDDPLAALLKMDLGPGDAIPSVPVSDDPLASLMDIGLVPITDAPPVAPEPDDPLAGLLDIDLAADTDNLATPEDPDDPLAALLAIDLGPAATDLPATATPDPVDDALAALDALLAPPPAAMADPAVDVLADLEALLAGDGAEFAPPKADDPLAALEDLLAAPPDAAVARPARKEMTMSTPSRPMGYGTLTAAPPAPGSLDRPVFRIAILGDFSGRSANGKVETGDRLAKRRAIRLDVDSIEDVIEGFATTLVLPIGQDGQGIEVELGGLDDLHPDELVDKVDLFGELKGLRRRLANPSTAARAVAELQGWGKDFTAAALPTRSKSSAGSVPADRRLSDFQSLIGDAQGRLTQPSPASDLIARIVGPHVVPGPNPEAKAMLATVDEAMSAAMRLVLHHPEFQAIEAAWRSLDLIARQIETDEKLEITIFDVSAEEFAADIGTNGDLGQTGLFQLLNEPLSGEGGIGFSAVFGLYTFEETPPHAELLGRMGRIAAHLQAPFVASMSAAFMDVAKRDRHPLVAQAWDGLRGDPVASWVALASPRFLLRRPYGKRSDPIDSFAFEEFTMSRGLAGMLWANPAALVAILLARTWTEGKGKAMDLGKIMSISDMPYHVVNDAHGDQIALPCTERNVTTEKTEAIVTRGLMPVISIKGRDVVRLGSFQSLAGQELSGRWGEMPAVAATPPGRAPTIQAQVPAAPATDLDADLDALLAGFGDTPAPTDPGAIDADLAALLEGL